MVNNAGVSNFDPTLEMSTDAALRANLEVNFFGVATVSRAALPLLRASGGRLVTIGSVHGVVGQPFNEAYCAAKFAVEGFMEALAPVAEAHGVAVSVVVPGFVADTSFGVFPDVDRTTIEAASGRTRRPSPTTWPGSAARAGRARARARPRSPTSSSPPCSPTGRRSASRRTSGPRSTWTRNSPTGTGKWCARWPGPGSAARRPQTSSTSSKEPVLPAKSLQELVDHARWHSPFYAEAYRDVPETVSHITQLPIVDQAAFWAANTWPHNRLLTGPLTDAGVYKTGGTTGSPKFSPWTRSEHADAVTSFGAGMVQAGLKPGHRVANLFCAGELYSGMLFIEHGLHAAPVENVRLPVGCHAANESIAELIGSFGVQVLAGEPMKLAAVAETLVASGQVAESVELLLFGGDLMFDDLRPILGARSRRPRSRRSGMPLLTPGWSPRRCRGSMCGCTRRSRTGRWSRSWTTRPGSR